MIRGERSACILVLLCLTLMTVESRYIRLVYFRQPILVDLSLAGCQLEAGRRGGRIYIEVQMAIFGRNSLMSSWHGIPLTNGNRLPDYNWRSKIIIVFAICVPIGNRARSKTLTLWCSNCRPHQIKRIHSPFAGGASKENDTTAFQFNENWWRRSNENGIGWKLAVQKQKERKKMKNKKKNWKNEKKMNKRMDRTTNETNFRWRQRRRARAREWTGRRMGKERQKKKKMQANSYNK